MDDSTGAEAPDRHTAGPAGIPDEGQTAVLVIDADADAREAVAVRLALLGHKVIAAADAAAASACYAKHAGRVSVVLADVRAPRGDAASPAASIIAAAEAAAAPAPSLLLFSAHIDIFHINRVLALRPFRLLEKPIDPAALSDAVSGAVAAFEARALAARRAADLSLRYEVAIGQHAAAMNELRRLRRQDAPRSREDASRALRRVLGIAKDFGTDSKALEIVSAIVELEERGEPPFVTAISRMARLPNATADRRYDQLIERGLLFRTPHDERRIVLRLTEQGRAFAHRVLAGFEDIARA